MRTWIVAFWTFVIATSPGVSLPSAMTVSVVVTLLAMPASIWGNELSIRHGRHRAITVIQIASAGVAISIGLLSGSTPWVLLMLVLVYAITVPADSGALTAGMSASAEPRFRGVTFAMHSTVGFGLSALAGWLVGATLDAFGGAGRPHAWMAAFCVLAVGVLCGPAALRWSAQGQGSPRSSESRDAA